MIRKNLGFTLIEIIVAVGVFSFVVTIMGSSFAQIIKLQRRALSAQKIQENSMYVLELMAREIRVSTVQSGNQACTDPGNFGTSLAITHPVSGTISYRSNNGIVYRTEGGIETSISSQDVKFAQLYFCIKGSGLDAVQTRVGIIAQVENTTGITSDKLIFNLQTTVTSRDTSNEFQN